MLDQVAITPDPQQDLAAAELALEAMQEEMREAVRKEQERVVATIQHIGSTLQRKMDNRVSLRSEIEQRWLKNIRQINGIYEKNELPIIDDPDAYGSRVYVPLTRRLRNMIDARMADILFPSDARMYVLDEGPVADLVSVLDAVSGMPRDASVQMPGGQPAKVNDVVQAFRQAQKEAEVKAHRLERQIDDRLAEAKFPAKARRAISDSIDYGTGVLKGPVASKRRSRAWTGQGFVVQEKIVPTVEHVPLWNWYPDMSATDIRDAVDVGEAHYMTKLQLSKLRGQPGFIDAAVDQVLSTDPVPETQSRRQDLRQLAGLSGAEDPRYLVWEYHGPISGADLNMCSRYERMVSEQGEPDLSEPGDDEGLSPDERMQADLMEDQAESDKPEYDDESEYRCCVWFCNGIVIKFALEPLHEGEDAGLYRVIYWQRDKSSIFGFGLPDEVRDQQSSCNGAFRATMDHMGLSVGPMIIIDDDAIEPVDGKRDIRPLKVFRKKNAMADMGKAFAFHQINSHVDKLIAVFNQSKQLMDEIATMPAFGANAEQTPAYTQSATGASLAYQTSTMWVRRMVRNWDDDIIEPMIGDFVQWEMIFNEDDSIKGDFKPVARGVSGLIELEGQGSRMMQFAQLARSMGVPDRDQLRTLRLLARSLKLDPDEVLPSEEELQQMQGAGGPSIEQQKLEVARENNVMDHTAQMATLQTKNAEIQMRSEEYARREKLALLEIAAAERSTLEATAQKYGYDLRKLEAEMVDREQQRAHEARMLNAESTLKLATGSGV